MFDLYVVTDSTLSNGLSDSEVARLAYEGGADVVQLRMKGADHDTMLAEAKRIKAMADAKLRFFIVNDDVNVALESGADGVHLGQSDMPVKDARKILGEQAIIGVSVTNMDEARKAIEDGADYLGVGSIFSTDTKKDAAQNLGLDLIFMIKQELDTIVVAIGGINQGNIQDVIRAGADSAAVVSAVVSQPDIAKAAHDLRDLILKVRPAT